MPDPTIEKRLKSLILSAAELQRLNPDWKPAMIEDYLTLFENFSAIADYLDSSYLVDLIFGEANKIEIIDNGDGSITITISDNYLPNNVLGTTDKIEITDNGDGTISITISDTYLSGAITGDDFIGVTDNGDGTIDLDNEGMESHVNFMTSMVGSV